MPRLLRSLLTLTALGCIGWLGYETFCLAELAGRAEHAAWHTAAAARTAAVEHAEARTAADERAAAAEQRAVAAAATIQRLEVELAAAQARVDAMAETVRQRSEAERERNAAAATAAARALEPMPEGVRLCLQALHECLRAEGFGAHRFLQARRLDGDGLHDVELLEVAADQLGVSMVQAGRVTATLDRGRGRLELRCFDGVRIANGLRIELPADGWPIVFEPVDGRLFEERLPALVRCEGVHPDASVPGRRRAAGELDRPTRLDWLERFDRLLAAAATPERLRVQHLRGLLDGHFQGVQLLGTDDKHRLLVSAECERLAVEVDESAGVVSLLLCSGVLRRDGAESTIGAEGYRMLLPKLTPKQASDTMLGMVVRR
jgi:hypothetical protein